MLRGAPCSSPFINGRLPCVGPKNEPRERQAANNDLRRWFQLVLPMPQGNELQVARYCCALSSRSEKGERGERRALLHCTGERSARRPGPADQTRYVSPSATNSPRGLNSPRTLSHETSATPARQSCQWSAAHCRSVKSGGKGLGRESGDASRTRCIPRRVRRRDRHQQRL